MYSCNAFFRLLLVKLLAKKRYVITGAPCSGKSTLIQLLSRENIPVFQEAARFVINEELANGSDNVPWKDNYGFSSLVVDKQVRDFKKAQKGLNFYDRALPDVSAYLHHHDQKHLLDKFVKVTKENTYEKDVFILPPWKEIYSKDEARVESFEEAISIDTHLKSVYKEFGYNLITVPFASPINRLKFILDHCL